MRARRLFTVIACVVVADGCVTRPGTLDRSLAPGAQWTATIVPQSGSRLHGTVTFVRTDPPSQTRAVFALADGPANAVLPWHIHYGVCGNDRLIVGSPANYPPLMLGSNGGLSAVAQLPVELSDGAKYVIHLHASPVDVHTVIACSALVPDRGIANIAASSR
jgi:hypothetical protein